MKYAIYPTGLPYPTTTAAITPGKTLKYSEEFLQNYKVERIAKKYPIVNLNFLLTYDEYIEFENFFSEEVEGGKNPVIIYTLTDSGVQEAIIDLCFGLEIEIIKSRVNINCQGILIVQGDLVEIIKNEVNQ